MPEDSEHEEGPGGETTAKYQVHIDGSREEIFAEITRTDAPIASFFNSQMHLGRLGLRPGARLAMRSPDAKYTAVVGEILELDPPRRFAHTFRFTNYDDPECAVIYDLEEASEGGTLFTLTIRDLPLGTKTAKQMRQGGVMITRTLKAVIEDGRPGLGTRALFVLFRLMAPLNPKRCRSQHWPVDA